MGQEAATSTRAIMRTHSRQFLTQSYYCVAHAVVMIVGIAVQADSGGGGGGNSALPMWSHADARMAKAKILCVVFGAADPMGVRAFVKKCKGFTRSA